VAPNETNVTTFAELLRVRRLISNQPQPRDAPTFLIDCDDRLDRAQVAQVVDQFPQLHRALDVPAEDDEAARLHFAKERGGFAIDLFAGHTREDQLTERSALHKVGP
jgi:hypothetical protein